MVFKKALELKSYRRLHTQSDTINKHRREKKRDRKYRDKKNTD